jgi:Xaa-Pro aminopeptidase
LARVRVDVSEERLFPERAVKRRREVAWIRQAQRAAAAGLDRALMVLKASRETRDGVLIWRGQPLTSERLRSEIHQVLLAHGCGGFETIAACGPASADPHERGHGRLRARQPIVLDIFPRGLTHGYWGDLTRTVVKGPPSAVLQAMYAAVKEAHGAALAAVGPRVACRTVHRVASGVFERLGFRTETAARRPKGFIHGTGHGVGLEVHESPSVSARPGRLRAGNVITIEPGLYDPAVGGVRIEDTIEVTSGGWRWVWPVKDVFRI